MTLRTSEAVALAYFVLLALAAMARPVSAWRRGRVAGLALATTALVLVVAMHAERVAIGPGGQYGSLRDWIFPVFVLAGYWLPAGLVREVDPAFEQWLLRGDRRWLGHFLQGGARLPRVAAELLELAYLWCYPLIPGGFVLLALHGAAGEADRYWTALMWASALSYGPLPWAASRPPRAVEAIEPRPRGLLRRVNLLILGHASVQLNTCPSGHVATGVAAALAVWGHWPAAGAGLALLAVLIAVASVARRYHYLFDAVSGAAVGLVAYALSRAA